MNNLVLVHCYEGFEEGAKIYFDVVDLHVSIIHLLSSQILGQMRLL